MFLHLQGPHTTLFIHRIIKSQLALFLFVFTLACSKGVEEPQWALCADGTLCSPVVKVLTVTDELSLEPDSTFWLSANGPIKTKIDLGPQLITNPQWPDPSIKSVTVSAAKNKSHIALRVQWDDATVDNKFSPSNLYTDQIAIMFPMKNGDDVPLITMGEDGKPVNIWLWKAVLQEEMESSKAGAGKSKSVFPGGGINSPVDDLNAEGFSTLTAQEQKDVMGKGVRVGNSWHVVFKRKLTNDQNDDVQFINSTAMAIAAWNGGNRETNGQKGIAGWILLKFS
ncbi:MAG: ethylbenzene dehydrogenase-related protein [Nitrospinales bacterium]